MIVVDYLMNNDTQRDMEDIEKWYEIIYRLTDSDHGYGMMPVQCLVHDSYMYFSNAVQPIAVLQINFLSNESGISTHPQFWKEIYYTLRTTTEHVWVPIRELNDLMEKCFVYKVLKVNNLEQNLKKMYDVHSKMPYGE